MMRAVVVLLCTLACDVRAENFLSPGAARGAQTSTAALLQALSVGGCGQPCARVLHSAAAAISNTSAGTVRLACFLVGCGVLVHGSCVFFAMLPCLPRLFQDAWMRVFRELGTDVAPAASAHLLECLAVASDVRRRGCKGNGRRSQGGCTV